MIPRSIHRPGRNDSCWCGSGRKYKACHLQEDEAKETTKRAEARAAAELEQEQHEGHRCAIYEPQTHKVPAIERPDFAVSVRNLASTGPGAWLHIDSPVDLGKDQDRVDAAISFLDRNGVLPDFRLDPSPPVISATQQLLDRMLGRGVFQVLPSGVRLRRYGRTEVAARAGGDGFVAFLSGGSSMQGVVHVLLEATRVDGAALGVSGGLLARVWPMARVAREVIRNKLSLPEPLGDRASELAAALLDGISQAADVLDHQGARPEVVRAQAALPYLVGLREAVSEPQGQLEAMGLDPTAVRILAVQLETANDAPAWLHQLADLAGEEWDTPDGYQAWVAQARATAEIADVLDSLPAGDTSGIESEPTGPLVESPAADGIRLAAAVADAAADALGIATDEAVSGASASQTTVFQELDVAERVYAELQAGLRDRLAGILDQRDRLARDRQGLQSKLLELEVEEADIDEMQTALTGELDAQADAHARSRHEAAMAILARGATQLDQAAIAWSQALLASTPDGLGPTLTEAERVIREYEDMEHRGLIAQLPEGTRTRVIQETEEARSSLRKAFGGRDPIAVPAVVAAAEDDPGLTLTIGLPIAGASELKPGALQTAVAMVCADAIADVVRSMPQIDVAAVDHERCETGASLLRIRFSGPPPVSADECAQYCAVTLKTMSKRSESLRAAGVSIEARVEPDFEIEV